MKIAELLENYNQITNTTRADLQKVAFVPNPAAVPQQPAAQPGAMPPQAAPAPQQAAMPPQAAPAPAPQQAAMPPQPAQGGAAQPGPLMSSLLTALSQTPPQVQQQIAPMLQKLMSLPPEQQELHLSQLMQAQQAGGGAQGMPPGGGMVAQASVEDLYAALQGGGEPQQGADMSPGSTMAQEGDEDAQRAEASVADAKNQLDNVRISLTVRELLDLVSKGTASASLFKVKQLADAHKQKMEQTKQKAEAAQQQQSQQQQADQQGMMGGGGIYPSPMGGAA